MASYCGKCGVELSPDKQFCASCGAPVAAPVAAPAVVVVPVQPAAPVNSGGTSALKIILIIIAIVVGLGILGAGAFGFMVWRVAHAFHASGPNGQVSMNIPGTSITANTSEIFTASDLGTDIYPGATPGKGSMRMNLGSTSMVHGIFVTSDSKDQVFSFYKEKFGSDAFAVDNASSAVLSVNKGKQESIMVTITANPAQNDGKTQISIMHTTNSKPS